MISKISQQNIEHIFFFIMLDTAFYREKLNENRFVIFIMSTDMHSLLFHLGN